MAASGPWKSPSDQQNIMPVHWSLTEVSSTQSQPQAVSAPCLLSSSAGGRLEQSRQAVWRGHIEKCSSSWSWGMIFIFFFKEGRWEYHLKYIEQNSYSYLLSLQRTNKGQLTSVASWQVYFTTIVTWPLFVFVYCENSWSSFALCIYYGILSIPLNEGSSKIYTDILYAFKVSCCSKFLAYKTIFRLGQNRFVWDWEKCVSKSSHSLAPFNGWAKIPVTTVCQIKKQ